MDRKERDAAARRRLATLDRVNHDGIAWWDPVDPEPDVPPEPLPDWAGVQSVQLGWTRVDATEADLSWEARNR